MKLKCNLVLTMMYFMYYSLCCMNFAKNTTLRHVEEESQVLSYTGLLILRLLIEKGVKWHIVESGHRTMRQFADNHLLLTKTEHLKLWVCTSCQCSTNLR